MLNVRQNCLSRAMITALLIAAPAMAQTPQFDVASVKPSPPERPNFPFHIGPGSFSMQGWLSDLAGRTKDLIDEVDAADLVVMVATAGENAQAAALIGEACSLRRITTTGLILGGASASDEMLSKTLSQMRPWSLMLVIASAVDYIEDMLIALRA